MDNHVPRKWEYISDRCQKGGLDDLALLARQIDNVMRESNYPEFNTQDWITDYDSCEVERYSLYFIVLNKGYLSNSFMYAMETANGLNIHDKFMTLFYQTKEIDSY